MNWKHPIGDDHPFRAVYALAQAEGYDLLEMVDVYDGALIRLFCLDPDICFKLKGDPGSAIDRQRFDYSKHVFVPTSSPEELLETIKAHIAEGVEPRKNPGPIGRGQIK